MAVSGQPIATRYSKEFVLASLPKDARHVLEIGCGRGELAKQLADSGLEVVAIDPDETAAGAAAALGVDATVASWPVDLGKRFDAVLFSRSLHHIDHLDGAISAAIAALGSSGRIIVEDFRAEGGAKRSDSWFAGLCRVLHANGTLPLVDALLAKLEPDDHDHHLHSSDAIAAALSRYGQVQRSDAAYYFRYLEPDLSPASTEALLHYELDLMSIGAIDGLGKRYVLSPPEEDRM